MLWIARDDFVDREEGQHVTRAIRTHEALRSGHPPWSQSREEIKAYYGWLFYGLTAAVWSIVGLSGDRAVLVNLLYLVVVLAGTGVLATRLAGDPRAAPPAVLMMALSNGFLTWVHYFNPALFGAALLTAAAVALVMAEGVTRPGWALVAGLAAGLVTLDKPSSILFLAPLVLLLPRPTGSRAAWGVLAFLAGVAPALAWWWSRRDIVRFWSSLFQGLSRPLTPSALADMTLTNWMLNVAPLHAALILAAIGALAGRGAGSRAVKLLLWAVFPGVVIVLGAGNPGISKDYLPSLLPLALLVGEASLLLGARARMALLALLLAQGALYAGTHLFGAGPVVLRQIAVWPSMIPPRWMPCCRTEPYPDLLSPLVAELERLLPPGERSRCGCLPFPPYPVPRARHLPVVLIDGVVIGDENLDAWMRLQGRQPPWQLGRAPYGLSCGAFAVALDCASLVLLDADMVKGDAPALDAAMRRMRPSAMAWGQADAPIAVHSDVVFSVRRPAMPPACPGPKVEVTADCGDDYYLLHLRSLEDPSLAPRAATLARERLRAPEEGRDPAAVVFGEAYLARAVAGLPP